MNAKNLLSFRTGVVKDINEQVVLKLILEHKIISSSELVKLTGMRPSTIFNKLKDLSARSLVTFHGKGNSTDKGGKKPYEWAINNEAAYVIGIDVEVGEMNTVILDFGGKIVAKRGVQLDIGRNVSELSEAIITVVDGLIIENNIDVDKVLGLGVAFAGIVDYSNGIVLMSSVLPEINAPLYEKLSVLPFPVTIENNANAAAVGLKWNDKNSSRKNYIAILLEIDKYVSGLGMGIVINGELYHGSSFSAGEIFSKLPTLKEILSTIRSRFSESEVLKDYASSLELLDMEFLIKLAKNGDPIAKRVFTKIGIIVGQIITPAVSILNPDTIIITGMVAEVEEILIDSIRKSIDMNVHSILTQNLTITTDKYYHYCVAFGAAALILEDYFRLPELNN